MFLIQFIINIFCISNNNSFDTSDVASNTIDDTGFHSSDAKKFKQLSMQAITGFLMMFGWTAITCQNQFGFSSFLTIGISLVAGIFTAFIIRSIFRLSKRLTSSGSVFNIEDAIGKEAYVYQRISKGGVGKISMTLQHFTYEIDAVTHHPEDLPSFVRVKIIEKSDDNTVVVAPI